MKVGLFTDPHINKKMQQIQGDWKQSVSESFEGMIAYFRTNNLDAIICGGDFFDKALIEAWSLKMVMGVLGDLNSLGIPVYFDLGNHEIESENENIIEFLDIYDNLIPVTKTLDTGEFLIIPYSEEPSEYAHIMPNRIVITHHDIYGSSLAAGRSKAKFGLDPTIFKDARLVLNGHIHSRSQFLNVRNIGSFLCGAQGELRPYEHPRSYILDTTNLQLDPIENYKAIHFVTSGAKELDKVLKYYHDKGCKVVLRYEYETDADLDIFDQTITKYNNVLRHNLRRMIDVTNVTNGGGPVKSMIDIPSILQRAVAEDPKVAMDKKDEWTSIGIQLLAKGKR